MTRRSGSKPILAFILIGFGAFCLTAAALIPTYTMDKLAKTPLDLEVTTVATGFGDVLDASSLRSGRARVDLHVPLISQRYVTTEEPSDVDRITVQSGQTLSRADKPGESGLLTAIVDRETLDRVSSMPVDDPIGSIQTQPNKPGDEVSHTGLTYKFPIATEKKNYPYFDVNARRAGQIEFVEETEIDGVPLYHFHQVTPAIDLSTVVNSPTNKLTFPADTWGVAGGAQPVTMSRFYENVRDVWVEPKTGTIVNGQEQPFQYYAREAGKPEITVVKATLALNDNTIEFQIGEAKKNIEMIDFGRRTAPLGAALLGVLLLGAGIVLIVRHSRRSDASGLVANDGFTSHAKPVAITHQN